MTDKVTQADRDAAREICRWAYPKLAEAGDGIAAGRNDTHPMVKLLARHRTNTNAELVEAARDALAALEGVDRLLHAEGMMVGIDCPAIEPLRKALSQYGEGQ